MSSLTVYNKSNKRTGQIELDDHVWSVDKNDHVVWLAVKAYLANQRQGTACTKNRKFVHGGGSKPYRQKGTGRARAGTSRSPLIRGGGVIFGPNPVDYSQKLNKKSKNLALRIVLSEKLRSKNVIVLDKYGIEEYKTKAVESLLAKFSKKKLLVIDDVLNNEMYFSTRNLKNANYSTSLELNSYQALNCDDLMFTEASIKALEKRLKKG